EAPLSFAQEDLWLAERQGASFTIAAAIAIDGPLDPQVLQRALTDLVERHEPLRARFAPARPVQTFDGDPAVALDAAAASDDAWSAFVAAPFPAAGPRLR